MSHWKTRAYTKWNSMLQRCTNPKQDTYKTHGARGIIVCERWLKFLNFFEDMGECPKGLTLERIDNNGNYEPGNCRWATVIEQANNRRTSRYLKFQNMTKTCAEWSKLLNISTKVIHWRLKKGWSIQKTLTTPINNTGRKKIPEKKDE